MGISIWQLLILLVIVVLLFGTKRLRNLGGDLGSAVKGFRSAVKDGGKAAAEDGEVDETAAAKLEADGAEAGATVMETEAAPKEADRA